MQLPHSTFGIFSIHATSWEKVATKGEPSGAHFPLAWDFLNGSVAGVDHTTCYLGPPYAPAPPLAG